MGAEYSQPPRIPALTSFISEAFYDQRRPPRIRCVKCLGHGRLFVESECNSCRSSWSNHTSCYTCDGYGHQTTYELCDDCFGRGIK
ncbi:unnamed protein product [Rotaria socialis]|nr:unnamed protein product [Rotaria socialis]CAF3353034.1 unnamed protein product [Rotaria socialis]CAF4200696.1 unnamed protein product [Rotaria socialis]CAF4417063.1 unnamed protein product [Rotaria socialis]CAF4459710.1 unnamed protein product [Rotaria socialis]